MCLLSTKCMCRSLTDYDLLFSWFFPGFFTLIFHFLLSCSHFLCSADLLAGQLILLFSSSSVKSVQHMWTVRTREAHTCMWLWFVHQPQAQGIITKPLQSVLTSEHLKAAVLAGPEACCLLSSPQALRATNGIVEFLTSPGPILFPKFIIIPSLVL